MTWFPRGETVDDRALYQTILGLETPWIVERVERWWRHQSERETREDLHVESEMYFAIGGVGRELEGHWIRQHDDRVDALLVRRGSRD